MGMFSDLLGSSSHTQTTQSTSNVTNTQLAGGNIGGPATYGSGNTVIATDQGAVQSATDISMAALELGANESSTGAAVAIAGLAHASDAYTSSLALVGDVTNNSLNALSGSNQVAAQYAGKALDSVNRFATSALDANTYVLGKSLDSVTQSYNASLGQVNALAQQVSQSSQQTTDDTIKKIILYLVIGVAVIFMAKARG